jgi:predicted Zn-dependent protease
VSGYKNIIFLLSLILLLGGCTKFGNQISNAQNKVFEKEDMLIMFALEASNQGDYRSAFELFYTLYKSTEKYEYLEQSIDIAFFNQQYPMVVDLVKNELKPKFLSNIEKFDFVYAVSLMNTNNYDEALPIAKKLVQKDSNDQYQILLGNLYLLKKEYQTAYDIFIKVRENQPHNISLLITVSDVVYSYFNKPQEAIKMLDDYITANGCNVEICEKIYKYYMVQNDVDGMIATLKRNYNLMLSLGKTQEALGTLNVIIEMLKLKDINVALEFTNSLPDDGYKSLKLIEIYKIMGNEEKLLYYFDLLYKQTNDINVLAQMAIYEFESSKNKKDVFKSVKAKLEKVLETSSNHMYQNYLGYLLIDFDIDYQRGIELVKAALAQEPENYAYLDSLAWGHYKLKQCKKAYEIMDDIVKKVGTQHEEINQHWEAIKECNK